MSTREESSLKMNRIHS
jgi:hypothetical protein